jgi:hypothetical protein
MEAPSREIDALTRATVAVAWLIVANKPFYPLYVWYLAGDAVQVALGAAISLPFFAAIPFLARRSAHAARIALPVIGTCDTFLETRLLGQVSGTELFFAACIMLAALSFHPNERWSQRAVVAFVAMGFILSRALSPGSPPAFTDAYLTVLLHLNIFAVAGLMVFVAMRYGGRLSD